MLAAGLAAVIALVSSAGLPPAPARWVEDGHGFLSPAVRDQLDRRLEGYQRATGHQVVVWIGDTIGDRALDDWAVRTFAAWEVGRRGIDDGVALFLLADDRAIDLEIGYGLEERVPDATAARIIREVMTPKLQAGDRDGAVTAGVDAVLAAIEGQPWTGGPAPPAAATSDGPSTGQLVLGVLAAIAFVIFSMTHPRLALLLLWSIGTGRGGGRGRGGALGGFLGGGGRSGGGGARGRW